ncbi:MAG: response regulator [Candidatus Methylomirabilia bacterium]
MRTILAIEDSAIHLKILSRYLESSLGCRVLQTVDVEEAMVTLLRERPDLIIVDLMMPELDGVDLLMILQAKASWREIPVVVHSVANERNRVQALMNLGVKDYILKPFDPETAIPRLRKILTTLPPVATRTLPERWLPAPGRIPVLLLTAQAEFGERVRREADPLYDVVLVDSGPAALAAAIECPPWVIFLTSEIFPWDLTKTMRSLRALKALEQIPIIPLAQFELDPVQTRLTPPYTIAGDLRRITVTLEDTFTLTCLDALRTALRQAVGRQTEALVFDGAPLRGGLQVSLAAFRELAHELDVQGFLKVRGRLAQLSASSAPARRAAGDSLGM